MQKATIELNFVLEVEGEQCSPPDGISEHKEWLANLLRAAADAVEAQRISRISINVTPQVN